jgi:2-methylisocitrate lyase-like PEP mutase family enzyme
VALFINARTDLFLAEGHDAAQSLGEALDRAKAYAAAGASGFFIPGLRDDALIGRVCNGVALPVNVMVMDGVPSNDRLTELDTVNAIWVKEPADSPTDSKRANSACLIL